MGKVILGLTISLDGFAEDISGSVNTLYDDLKLLQETDFMKESILTTGAVVMSKKEFEMAEDPDLYANNYEYQVPIFVFTDKIPDKHPKETKQLTFTFVTGGIGEAIKKAKVAAGPKDVNIIGSAVTTQLCLKTNLADELQVDIIPIFLKTGHRPFEMNENTDIKLERILAVELPAGRTHLRFRIIREKNPGSQELNTVKMSHPAQRAFEAAGIKTLKELCEYREKDLLALHGVGPKAVRILKELLTEQGLSFKG